MDLKLGLLAFYPAIVYGSHRKTLDIKRKKLNKLKYKTYKKSYRNPRQACYKIAGL